MSLINPCCKTRLNRICSKAEGQHLQKTTLKIYGPIQCFIRSPLCTWQLLLKIYYITPMVCVSEHIPVCLVTKMQVTVASSITNHLRDLYQTGNIDGNSLCLYNTSTNLQTNTVLLQLNFWQAQTFASFGVICSNRPIIHLSIYVC